MQTFKVKEPIQAFHKDKSVESIQEEINTGLESNDIDSINTGLYKLADFMKVDLPYSNTKEFCDYMDSEEVLVL